MSQSPVILLVEDDTTIQRFIRKGLMELDYRILAAATLEEARNHIARQEVHLAVLDLGLPDGSGTDLLREMRAAGNMVPVIILTARDQVDDKVLGLDLGADDYLVKPFNFNELSARIRAHLRRSASHTGPTIQIGDLHIDLLARTVRRSDRTIECTPREFDVLVYLASNLGQPISREVLTREVWKVQSRMTSMDNVIDVLMSRLREKVDGGNEIKMLHTIRGLGFTIKAPE